MEYVFIAMGFKRVFCAPDRQGAVRLALSVAREVRAWSWLLFDRNGTLIVDSGRLPFGISSDGAPLW